MMRLAVAAFLALIFVAPAPAGAEETIGDLFPAPAPRTAAPIAEAPTLLTKPRAKSPVTLIARVDLTHQRMTVSQHGKLMHSWPVSSGTRDHPSPAGTFTAEWTAKLWHSRKYDDAPMPHAVFFHEGAAIHATTAMHMLGQPASHGCIRIAPKNAELFYGLVQSHGLASTQIIVQGTPRWQAPAPAVAVRGPDQLPPIKFAVAQSGSGWPSGAAVGVTPSSGLRWQNGNLVPSSGLPPIRYRSR